VSRHTVKLKSVVVGWSDLEQADPFAGTARGLFRPGVGYDLVQPIFNLYAEAVPSPGAEVQDQAKLDRYLKSRDALGLSLEDEHGRVVRTSAIHIEDYTGRRGGIAVEVLISDREYWERHAAR
jgi:hypothetical protein